MKVRSLNMIIKEVVSLKKIQLVVNYHIAPNHFAHLCDGSYRLDGGGALSRHLICALACILFGIGLCP